jgi:hypothetical protein
MSEESLKQEEFQKACKEGNTDKVTAMIVEPELFGDLNEGKLFYKLYLLRSIHFSLWERPS